MAFTASRLNKLVSNADAVFWTYSTSDPLDEMRGGEYWTDAAGTVATGDFICATSKAKAPSEAAVFFVSDCFAPTGHVAITSMS